MRDKLYLKRLTICGICAILSVAMLSGCSAGNKMALESGEPIDLTTKSIGLFTLRTFNKLKPSYEPAVSMIEIKSQADNKSSRYVVGKPNEQHDKGFMEYLVSVDLAPGTYTIGNVSGLSTGILTYGSFCYPVGATFEMPPDSVIYLGHVNMVNRKLQNGEKRSGSIFPLIDQAASGYSGGSFDITATDRSGTDIPLFEEKYPQLGDYIITPNVMSL